MKCKVCRQGYILDENTSRCVRQCQPGQYVEVQYLMDPVREKNNPQAIFYDYIQFFRPRMQLSELKRRWLLRQAQQGV
ncbi:hypothetical protein FGO68_gene14785 [Halteria grandinella]|uniref:Uncharacterized protein n=1 Tax=Halteria grandinella TaxID=5974 RepID=A0A8J8N979_HALGN|nr:hypothetical protein FGO68_gene14785 [Halteria grandinella]